MDPAIIWKFRCALLILTLVISSQSLRHFDMRLNLQAERLIENVGYPDYIMDVDIMTSKYKEVHVQFGFISLKLEHL